MNKHAEAWVEALRSGKYQQTEGVLHRVDHDHHTYCCLGVACELYIEAGNTLDVNFEEMTPNTYNAEYWDGDSKESSVLPRAVMDWLGLDSSDGTYVVEDDDEEGVCRTSLAADNDSGTSFDEIADIIESEPEELFS